MPNGTMTIVDLAVRTGNDALIGLVDEAAKACPEVSGLAPRGNEMVQVPGVGLSRTIQGRGYKTLVRTSVPKVGFRGYNEGSPRSGGTYENRMVETFVMNPGWEADVALADSDENGPLYQLQLDASANLEGMMQNLGQQFYYGTANDAKGFPGIASALSNQLTVDATGTTASTGSSVWAVRFGAQDVQWVYGVNGQMKLSDVTTRPKVRNNLEYTVYFQEMFAYPGVQVLRPQAVGRIKNLTEDNNKGLTKTLLRTLISRFPAYRKPHAIFLTQRSLRQYAESLVAYNDQGTPAPTPYFFEGIPLIATESLTDTEAIA
jgi:hypothetical protein